jgi:hypothetical protein
MNWLQVPEELCGYAKYELAKQMLASKRLDGQDRQEDQALPACLFGRCFCGRLIIASSLPFGRHQTTARYSICFRRHEPKQRWDHDRRIEHRCDFPEARRFTQELIADVFHAATGIIDQNIEPSESFDRRIDNLSAVRLLRNVSNQRQNPGLAAALQYLVCDGFNLGALARRSRNYTDSNLGKSEDQHRAPSVDCSTRKDIERAQGSQYPILTTQLNVPFIRAALYRDAALRGQGVKKSHPSERLTASSIGTMNSLVDMVRGNEKRWSAELAALRQRCLAFGLNEELK